MVLKKPLILGSFTYPDGSVYHGEWNLKGCKDGYGILYFSTGDVYSGKFRDDLFFELGHLQFRDGSFYVGEFLEGWFHGQGIYQSYNGSQYVGYFRGGKIFGHGQTNLVTSRIQLEGEHREWKFVIPLDCESIVENVMRMCRFFRINPEATITGTIDSDEMDDEDDDERY
ncbi:uncharacterized protein LOC141853113 [Brevipalpus obovatus]|uniref:uncharacterized protein LOC141853113 n=1 Tax=Brevipalpus obovatus TaxID=246614 RepID=UPI003D9DE35A